MEYGIVVHGPSCDANGAAVLAYQYQVPWSVRQTSVQLGGLPPINTFLSWSGDCLALSAFKFSEETGDIIARWFNYSQEEQKLGITCDFAQSAYLGNILEERRVPLAIDDGHLDVTVSASEIITIAIPKNS
ncbi:glycosyl hydrolase-related protein [Alicyclobacillus fastidiosus]|uniref:Glycosyl hydrolase-related protein n=1 Tax=Alicyclobacillus fastidiosus TaxID=392011 RepID=A0ABY6ZGQ1_9BACL|nr:glycosyl hydrolase-related protein [Alicyclobacillus fastidiosus]WAH41294.1 glycosyl hydrolase-related protein [Alicyclobacillus fastidiosus]GMA62895.1 hypothetical protein GCM10025859_33350 [Alicyclobacillus fastidiosus]